MFIVVGTAFGLKPSALTQNRPCRSVEPPGASNVLHAAASGSAAASISLAASRSVPASTSIALTLPQPSTASAKTADAATPADQQPVHPRATTQSITTFARAWHAGGSGRALADSA